MNYLELAKEQFSKLKEETLDEDRHCVGASNYDNYEVDDQKFKIEIEGFWETSDWFEWKVYDEVGQQIESGTEYE